MRIKSSSSSSSSLPSCTRVLLPCLVLALVVAAPSCVSGEGAKDNNNKEAGGGGGGPVQVSRGSPVAQAGHTLRVDFGVSSYVGTCEGSHMGTEYVRIGDCVSLVDLEYTLYEEIKDKNGVPGIRKSMWMRKEEDLPPGHDLDPNNVAAQDARPGGIKFEDPTLGELEGKVPQGAELYRSDEDLKRAQRAKNFKPCEGEADTEEMFVLDQCHSRDIEGGKKRWINFKFLKYQHPQKEQEKKKQEEEKWKKEQERKKQEEEKWKNEQERKKQEEEKQKANGNVNKKKEEQAKNNNNKK